MHDTASCLTANVLCHGDAHEPLVQSSDRVIVEKRRYEPDPQAPRGGFPLRLSSANVELVLAPKSLAGVRVVVTAGGTREPLDPVRALTNRSSGKMGFALAAEAARRGAESVLIAGASALPTPAGVRRIDVESALAGDGKDRKSVV